MMNLSIIGLSIIVLGWALQLLFMGKSKKIYTSFVGTYVLGVALLVYDGFSSGLNSLTIVNFISLIVALAVLVKLNLKERKRV